MPVLHCPGGHAGLEWQRGRLTRGQRHKEWRTGEGHTDLQPGLALRVRELRTEAGGGGELGPHVSVDIAWDSPDGGEGPPGGEEVRGKLSSCKHEVNCPSIHSVEDNRVGLGADSPLDLV